MKEGYKVVFMNQVLEAEAGENLRSCLIRHKLSPHNDSARFLNCKGIGTCGTCAVEIVSGELPPAQGFELLRLSLPPHTNSNRRLACKIQVHTHLELRKCPGFWGEDC